MKILFLLGRYLPDKKGGIENYTHLLAMSLLNIGHTVDVAILDRDKMLPYVFEGIDVIPLKADLNIFTSVLQHRHYDICHFQEYHGIRGINTQWIKTAKQFCQKVFFTFHLPYLTCYKNDFRYYGVTDCDHFTSETTCVKCMIATQLAYKDATVYKIAVDLITSLTSQTNKIKRLRENIRSRKSDLNELINCCDQIFIYGKWFKDILSKNGYTSPKLPLIPHLVQSTSNERGISNFEVKNRILFVGRIEQQKGLHLVCKALNLISHKEVRLDVAGNVVNEKYFESCRQNCTLNYLGALPHSRLLLSLSNYDFLILPSVFTEMYSLAIREAFSKQLPVIASAAKGNVDVIKEGKNGFIFNYNDYKDLASVIDKAYSLKKNGWKPEFETTDSHENDLKEILSYYS